MKNNQTDLPSSHHPEQGLLMNCIYCHLVYPDLKNNDCPVCKDNNQFFKPAQMMDKASSQIRLFQELSHLFQTLKTENIPPSSSELSKEELLELKDKTYSLLESIVMYNFDIKDGIIELIRDFDNAISNLN